MPESSPAPPGCDSEADTSSTHSLITILLGKEPTNGTRQNPRNIDFLEGIRAAKKARPKEAPLVWKNGIYHDETTSGYGIVDIWGNPFRIRIDTNNDNQFANPNPDQTAAGHPVILNKSAIVWSAGKDGDWSTWDDNPMSWDQR